MQRGKTPVLNEDQARHVLASIDTSTDVGLRDRALIGVMTYAFIRIGAVVAMRVEDYSITPRASAGGCGCLPAAARKRGSCRLGRFGRRRDTRRKFGVAARVKSA
jgi:hypothetical protein